MKRTPSPVADIKMEAMPGQPAPRARRKTCGGEGRGEGRREGGKEGGGGGVEERKSDEPKSGAGQPQVRGWLHAVMRI